MAAEATGLRPRAVSRVALLGAAGLALAAHLAAGSRPANKKGASAIQASRATGRESEVRQLMSSVDPLARSEYAVLDSGSLVDLRSEAHAKEVALAAAEAPTENDVAGKRREIQQALSQVTAACQVKGGSALLQSDIHAKQSEGAATNEKDEDHPGQRAKDALEKCLSQVKVLNQHLAESGALANEAAKAYAEQFSSVREAVQKLADSARTDGALRADWAALSQVLNGDISKAEANTLEISSKASSALSQSADLQKTSAEAESGKDAAGKGQDHAESKAEAEHLKADSSAHEAETVEDDGERKAQREEVAAVLSQMPPASALDESESPEAEPAAFLRRDDGQECDQG
eukprot:CAMPEP_0176081498 /NCGR_PEP_ID=MMETSP0120_2-20121206/40767_1 /TAXON_ID=160619 /ORGANISM="Kryptoperidinium foliaceum, Strain CCMP 1326" /LENGTH=346 /DNA_ID=CAMNT_0017415267 /DNA_START=98 /DNA_END=1133 /DNA_ORIENTATION=+